MTLGATARWAVLGALASGCGGGVRPAATFSGSGEAVIAGAEEVGEFTVLGPDDVDLGAIASSCELRAGAGGIDGAFLSDVDCSASRLTRALREGAAAAGGTAIAGKRCTSRVLREGESGERTRIACEARVVRPTADALWRERGRQDGEVVWSVPASDAWNIRVRFTPERWAGERPPRAAEHVAEVAVMPASHVALGGVVTRCGRGCGRDATREGVREVAGRVGAHTVVGVGCVKKGDGWVCTGVAAGYRADPAANRAAR